MRYSEDQNKKYSVIKNSKYIIVEGYNVHAVYTGTYEECMNYIAEQKYVDEMIAKTIYKGK